MAVLSEGRDRLDEAAGMLSLSRFVGSALAIAIGTSTYLSVAADPAATDGGAAHAPDEVAVGGSAFHDVVAQLRQDLRAPFEAATRARTAEAFATTMRLAAVVLLVLTLLSVWLLRPARRPAPRLAGPDRTGDRSDPGTPIESPSSVSAAGSEAEDLGGGLAEELDAVGVVAVGRQVAGEAVDAELEDGGELLADLVGVAPARPATGSSPGWRRPCVARSMPRATRKRGRRRRRPGRGSAAMHTLSCLLT